MVRPIDLQMIVPKSAEISKLSADENRRPEMEQQEFAKQLMKQVEREQQQVPKTDSAEGKKIDKDGKNKQEENAKKQRKKQLEDKKKQQAKEQLKNKGMFDVSI